MDSTSDIPGSGPANDNSDTFNRIDTGLDELYRLRRAVSEATPPGDILAWHRERSRVLAQADAAIRLALTRL